MNWTSTNKLFNWATVKRMVSAFNLLENETVNWLLGTAEGTGCAGVIMELSGFSFLTLCPANPVEHLC